MSLTEYRQPSAGMAPTAILRAAVAPVPGMEASRSGSGKPIAPVDRTDPRSEDRLFRHGTPIERQAPISVDWVCSRAQTMTGTGRVHNGATLNVLRLPNGKVRTLTVS